MRIKGSYKIEVSGNILVFEGTGPWSEEIVARYRIEMAEAVEQFQGEEWGFVGYLQGTALLTPDGESSLLEGVKWRLEHGMRACAIVFSETDCTALVRDQFLRIYNKAKVPCDFFETERGAFDWLAKYGFSMNQD